MILLSQLADFLSLPAPNVDVTVRGFSTDSRTIAAGDLFIALTGDTFNGHDYIPAAIAAGAAAVLASQSTTCSLPVLKVDDTQQALLTLATAWRQRFSIPVVAITGSCGKTSTRALLQSILSTNGKVLASERSYNNHIGVPLTLLRLRSEHRYAVIEIGTNHPGEIAQLVSVARPDVAVLTNAGPSHLEGLGDVAGVAREKGDIFSTLDRCGTAVLNQDDAFFNYWLSLVRSQVLTFGLSEKAMVRATKIEFNDFAEPSFRLTTAEGHVQLSLPLLGKHNVYNALAASAAATALNIPLNKIRQGLMHARAESRRLVEQKGYAAATIIDDSYNANPLSVKAAIDVLAQRPGISILVLGDMGELGAQSAEFHQQIGVAARQAGVAHLFCYGERARAVVRAFGERAYHFEQQADLLAALRPLLNEQVTVLVKGSNAMGMDGVTQRLLEE